MNSPKTSLIFIICFVLLAGWYTAFLPAVATAQSGGQMVAPGWVHEHWTAADGLPVNSVNAVVQGLGGYIWLATFDGLVRFDGMRFTVFNSATHPNLPSNRFTELVRTEDGALWLLSEQHHLIRFQQNEFTVFDTETGLPHNDVFVLRPEPDSSLFIGTHSGVARYRQGRVEQLTADEATGAVHCFYRGPEKTLWIGANEGVFRLGNDEKIRAVVPAEMLPSNVIWDLALVRDSLWIGTSSGATIWDRNLKQRIPPPAVLLNTAVLAIDEAGGTVWFDVLEGVYSYRAGRVTHFPGPAVRAVSISRQVAWTDEDGMIWINTGRRLLRLSAETSVQAGEETIFHARAQQDKVITDREGNLWIPTEEGLHRLRASPFKTFLEEDGLHSENIYPILENSNGTVWVGTLGGGIAGIHKGKIRTYGPEVGVPDIVWAMEEDKKGFLWIGGNDHLCRFQDGVCSQEEIPVELATATVRAIHQRTNGSIWFGTPEGLYRLEDDEWQNFTPEDGVPRQPVRVFLEGDDGSLWMGTNGGGIIRLKEEGFTTYRTEDGLCSNLIRALHFDSHGALWVGTEDQGLCRVDLSGQSGGDLSGTSVLQIDQQDGLYDYGVHRILDDGMGRLWMSGNQGIWWVRKDELDAFVAGESDRIHSTVYTETDGLPTREANGGVHPAGIRASDGRLWFPTQAGAVVFDPQELPRNTLRPPVHIEQVAVGTGGERRTLAAFEISDQLVLSPGERQLEITYTAPSFIDPSSVRFRYRLEGFDENWVEAGTRRLATYTNLRPDEYRFQVIAANADGVWNEAGTAFGLLVRPYWYETRTFFVFCAVLLVAAGLFAGRWRQREHKRRRRELETQVEERTEELSDALTTVAEQAAALEELDKAKSRFFANISHEFRTPLTVILGGLKDALAGRFRKDPEKLAEQRQVMLRNTQHLQGLIEQILDLNRLESGHLTIEPAPGDLVRFLTRMVEVYAPLAERNTIDLTLDCQTEHCPRLFDREKLEKIAGNLLSNALKFTPQGGKVHVSLYCGEEVRISVADNGPGIPPEAQEQIFERFAQLDANAKHGGTGIGLALAHELAGLHGGTIDLKSTPGEGSTFTARLPLEEAALSEIPNEENPGSVSAETTQNKTFETGETEYDKTREEDDRTTVLIIEDNEDVRAYIRRSLEETYKILEAADGESGLEMALDTLPDLVVTDVMLPGIDGHMLVRQLKADPAAECIPVVMLTARAATDDRVEGYESGAEAYLVKPFDPETLRAVVARLFRERLRLRRHLRQELRGDLQDETELETNKKQAITERARSAILTYLYDRNFDIRELASLLSVSRSSLYRSLKEESGLTPATFIRTVRLEKAIELLSNGAGSVSEVAYAVGFKSLSHFTHRFREHYGKLPSTVLDAKK